MYAAKFKLDTVAAVFKIGGKDLGQPIGRRAKSVVGNDESSTPKGTILQGILYCKYNEIPDTAKNMIKANWKPEYIKYLDDSKDSTELIEYLQKESANITRNPITQLEIRMRNTISSQGAQCSVCGTTEDVQMHHIKQVKKIKESDKLAKHQKAVNITQIPLCRKHHLEAHKGT